VDQKKAELLDQRARLGELLRSQAAHEREMGGFRLELQSAAIKERHEDSRYERERVQLAQEAVESEARGAATITAPADGVATALLGEPGQSTQAQTVLLTILPQDAPLQAKLMVPSRAIGFLAVGDTVSLRYPAFPYQRFGSFNGRIVEIPRSTVAGVEAGGPTAQTDAVFQVSVKLDDQQVRTGRTEVPLQNGMAVEADVWVERMTLLQWIFERLVAAAAKV
jgi:membrane fusion protein